MKLLIIAASRLRAPAALKGGPWYEKAACLPSCGAVPAGRVRCGGRVRHAEGYRAVLHRPVRERAEQHARASGVPGGIPRADRGACRLPGPGLRCRHEPQPGGGGHASGGRRERQTGAGSAVQRKLAPAGGGYPHALRSGRSERGAPVRPAADRGYGAVYRCVQPQGCHRFGLLPHGL